MLLFEINVGEIDLVTKFRILYESCHAVFIGTMEPDLNQGKFLRKSLRMRNNRGEEFVITIARSLYSVYWMGHLLA
jgi:hypothetical protein